MLRSGCYALSKRRHRTFLRLAALRYSPRPYRFIDSLPLVPWTLLLLVLALPAQAVEVIKSPNDDRRYRYLELPNQLEVLLISDPDTDTAAAALDVFVGSADDPRDRQGLAHFLEHMLFLGTEKYPEADDYQNFINSHGGSHNAYTAFEHTNYFFEVDADHLEGGLDRFAQFFLAPRFDAEYVARERNAVHSEYQARLTDEFRRRLDVFRELVNPRHPLSKFSIGSLSTLPEKNLRRDLLRFYRKHYNAEAMALVVTGRESLDELEQMVETRFSDVPNREAAPMSAAEKRQPGKKNTEEAAPGSPVGESTKSEPEPVFLPEHLPLRVAMQPEKDVRRLSLVFPTPPVKRLYRKKPTDFLANLLGHEGAGSLFAVLKDRGWAEALTAGTLLSLRNDALFEIDMELTETGLENREAIVGLVFAAIDRVTGEGVEEWRFEELQRLGEIAFRFQEDSSPLATVRSLASNLHYYEPADVVAGDYLLQEYDPELLKHFASLLTPENVLITVTAPDAQTGKESRFFSTPYAVESAPMELAEVSPGLTDELALPEPNPFIPQDLSLKPRPSTGSGDNAPNLIKNAAGIKVWFQNDETYNVPRTSAFLRLKSPEAAGSLQGGVLMELYAAMMRDRLNEYAYPASLAGLHYSLEANSRGLDVVVTGYNDGQDRLFRRIVEKMHTPRFSRQRFARVKSELSRRWRNVALDTPYQQLMSTMPALLFSPWWSIKQRVNTLEELTYKDLNRFTKRAFSGSRAKLLLYGNLTRSEAARLAGLVQVELLSAMADKHLRPAEVVELEALDSLAQATVFGKPVTHNDRAAVLYLQGGDDTLEESARMMLLRQVLRPAFFHQLRTRQQLGYVVFVAPMPFKDVPGAVFVVQSPMISLAGLREAIEEFINTAVSRMPDDLAQHKRAVVNELLEAPKNLHQQASRYWENIINDDDFDRRERLAEAVAAVDADNLRTYLRAVLNEQPRALWVFAGRDLQASAAQDPDAVDDDTTNREGEWLSIDQGPAFKAKRESYVYP